MSIIDTIRTGIAENVGPGSNAVAKEHETFAIDDVPDLSGKTFVVTGGSQGIGYACVHTYLSKNAKSVHVISPTEANAQVMREDVEKDLGKGQAERITWHQLDLADWNGVTRVATDITRSSDRIDGLVLNAARGIMTAQMTDYGVDRHMAINHFAHVILTSHLMPLLKKTAETSTVRISFQGSNAHQSAPGDIKFASLEEINKDRGAMAQYGTSKLATILYARFLAHQLSPTHPNIKANATHPGFVETTMSSKEIMEPFPVAGHLMKDFPMPLLKKDQWQGAAPTLFCSTVTTETGQYICPPKIVEPGTRQAQDAALGEQLMRLTVQVIQDKTRAQEEGCPLTPS